MQRRTVLRLLAAERFEMSTIAFIIALYFCISHIVIPVSCTEEWPTGLVVDLHPLGLNYIAKVAAKKFESQTIGSSDFIPDCTETTETANISIRNISVTDFNTSQTNQIVESLLSGKQTSLGSL